MVKTGLPMLMNVMPKRRKFEKKKCSVIIEENGPFELHIATRSRFQKFEEMYLLDIHDWITV